MGGQGPEGSAGSSGDLSGGHRGHEGCSGHTDRSRRYDLATPPLLRAAWATAAYPAARPSRWTRRTRSSSWRARPTARATGSPSTVPPVTFTTASSRRLKLPSPVSLAALWRGATSTASCRYAPMPILPTTPLRRASSALRASACAVPSTCSSTMTVSTPSAR